MGLSMQDESGALPTTEKAQSFAIRTIGELDRLLAKHEQDVIHLSSYMRPRGAIDASYSLDLLFLVLGTELGSAEAMYQHFAGLEYSSASRGFVETVCEAMRYGPSAPSSEQGARRNKK